MEDITIYITYSFGSIPYDSANSYGYSDSVHCNYINKLTTDDLLNKDISLYFNSADDFAFMSNATGVTSGDGWTATKVNLIAQIVEGDIEPEADKWKIIDVTDQILGHTVGNIINKENLVESVLKLTQSDYNAAGFYNLDYLDYPTSVPTDENKLTFGEERYFFGNVRTDIEAIAYTTDISIPLPLNQFNSTTNPTWDGVSSVQLDEIGIYDDNGNLVAIGKLNSPISKDSTIARTIAFSLDF